MMKVSSVAEKLSAQLELLKELEERFPELTVSEKNLSRFFSDYNTDIIFRSGKDDSFDKWEFVNDFNSLSVELFTEVEINNFLLGRKIIRVGNTPSKLLIARTRWNAQAEQMRIEFSEFSSNYSKYGLDNNSQFLIECKAEVFKFIGQHPNWKIDAKNMHPALKKLLIFA